MGKRDQKKIRDAIDARRAQVAAWYWEGIPQNQMAERLGVSDTVICTDIKFLRGEWLKDRKANINQWIINELEKIDWMESEARTAWENSKTTWKPSKNDPEKRNPDPEHGEVTKMVYQTADGAKYGGEVVRLSHGNPKYLEQIRWCIEQRCKLLGLIVEKHQHGGEDGKPIPIAFIQMSIDEL